MARSQFAMTGAALWIVCALVCLDGVFAIHRETIKKRCGGFFISDLGRIVSHRRYGRRMSPGKMLCTWRIYAPPGHRVRLLATTMSLEAGPKCEFDSLRMFDGFYANSSLLIGSVCGSRTDNYFVSKDHVMTLVFRTDTSVHKSGFVLRYVFEDPSDDTSTGGMSSRRQPCGEEQVVCKKSGLCIPDALLCDGINDCGDNSDEKNCPSGTPKACERDDFSCDGKQCIPRRKVFFFVFVSCSSNFAIQLFFSGVRRQNPLRERGRREELRSQRDQP